MNKLIIAAAGAGKTTYLVRKACEKEGRKILITTFTTENEAEIRAKIVKEKGYIPTHISIQTWFSFLLQHGVRPYQDVLNSSIHEKQIGFFLVHGRSGRKTGPSGKPIFWGESDFERFYFTDSFKIYSDKISKFICKCNTASGGNVISRIEQVFDEIYIDEVQDLAGYDLEILKLLFASKCDILLVGDPRQSTYATHYEAKYDKYFYGKIKEFIVNELGKKIECEIDEKTLNTSHRNPPSICAYSSILYPHMTATQSCSCCKRDSGGHEGVFLVKPELVDDYLAKYKPVQLRWDVRAKCSKALPAINMGESKGLSFERVLIYPTDKMKKFIRGNREELTDISLAKFYVALTRAYHSVGIVFDYKANEQFVGVELFTL